MERTSSQKVLRVIAIISIVFAVLGILAGALIGGAGGLIGTANPSDVAEMTSGTGLTQGQAAGIVGGLGIVAILASAIELIEGILCLRASNDSAKVKPAWIFSIISLGLNIVSIIWTAINGTLGQNIGSTVAGLAIAGLIFYLCNNIKQEAGI